MMLHIVQFMKTFVQNCYFYCQALSILTIRRYIIQNNHNEEYKYYKIEFVYSEPYNAIKNIDEIIIKKR